jgi:hypothetical protein
MIQPCFSIGLHVKDLELLNSIQKFFNVGSVTISRNKAEFRVRSKSELRVIINHFINYPLLTSKALNFMYFCEILNLRDAKVHTSVSGFLKLASLINKLNNPLSESLVTKLLELGPLPNVEFETKSNFNVTDNLNPF